jgi:broad specificity phosphatase PhoE
MEKKTTNVFRHGNPIDKTPESRLSEKGIAQAENIGRFIKEQGNERNGLILSSPSPRVIHTAETATGGIVLRTPEDLFDIIETGPWGTIGQAITIEDLLMEIKELNSFTREGMTKEDALKCATWDEVMQRSPKLTEFLKKRHDEMLLVLEKVSKELGYSKAASIFTHGQNLAPLRGAIMSENFDIENVLSAPIIGEGKGFTTDLASKTRILNYDLGL